MPRLLRYAIFLTVTLLLAVAVHYYLWARLVRDMSLPPVWRRRATIVLVALAVAMPLLMIVARYVPPEVARWLVFPGFVWMGLAFLLFVVLAAADLFRLLGRGAVAAAGRGAPDPARRQFLGRVVGGTATALAAGVGGVAMAEALATPGVRPVDVPLARLPRALDGTTIVQLTDLHIGPMLGRAWLESVVRQVNALQPDVVAITGDLVDGTPEDLRESIAPLGDLRARWGVYFVTGNHEFYSGLEPWLRHLPTLGVRVLRNDRVAIGEGDATYDLAGIDDPTGKPDLAAALAGRDPSRELVLLAHQPKAIHEAARAGVGLQLSGHTHAGQIWPFRYLVYFVQPYVDGLHKHEGRTWIYVSRGTGFWGPPMRFHAPPEITRVVLRAAS